MLGALALSACGSGDGGVAASQGGELAQGTFRYRCLDGSDAACDGANTVAAFPSLIAVGGRFGAEFSGGVVEVASSDFLVTADGGFRAVREGKVALIGRTSADGSAPDFTHLSLAAIKKLVVSGGGDDATAPPGVGARFTYRVVPQSSDGTRLAGSLRYRWATSDASVLALAGDTSGAVIQVEAKAIGEARLTVQLEEPGGPAAIEVVLEVAQ
jgi:hypothetical protein